MRKIGLGLAGIVGALGLAAGCNSDNALSRPDGRHYTAIIDRVPATNDSTEWESDELCEENLQNGPVELFSVDISARPEGRRDTAPTVIQSPNAEGNAPPFNVTYLVDYNERQGVSHVTVFAEDNNEEFVNGGRWPISVMGFATNGRQVYAEKVFDFKYSRDCDGQGNVNENSNSAVNENDNVIDNGNSNVNYNDNNGQGNVNENDNFNGNQNANGNANANTNINVNDNQGGPITCVSNADCDRVYQPTLSCNGNDVVHLYQEQNCINPGTDDSRCEPTGVNLSDFVQNCGTNSATAEVCNPDTGNFEHTETQRGCENAGDCFERTQVVSRSCTYGCDLGDIVCNTLDELRRGVDVKIVYQGGDEAVSTVWMGDWDIALLEGVVSVPRFYDKVLNHQPPSGEITEWYNPTPPAPNCITIANQASDFTRIERGNKVEHRKPVTIITLGPECDPTQQRQDLDSLEPVLYDGFRSAGYATVVNRPNNFAMNDFGTNGADSNGID